MDRKDSQTLKIAQIVPLTEAEGPGRRFAIWVQGCPLRCPECCNPEMLPFDGGETVSVDALIRQIKASEAEGIEGITLLGGEPFAQTRGASALARAVQRRNLSVMVFSGFELAEIRGMSDPFSSELLKNTDVLVDSPFLREQPETERRWIGSSNQRIHFLTERYRADDPRWKLANTLEIRLRDGELRVNGFPAANAASMWRRIGKTSESEER